MCLSTLMSTILLQSSVININFQIILSIVLLTQERQPYIDESTDIKHRNFKISKKWGINDLRESKDIFFKQEWGQWIKAVIHQGERIHFM